MCSFGVWLAIQEKMKATMLLCVSGLLSSRILKLLVELHEAILAVNALVIVCFRTPFVYINASMDLRVCDSMLLSDNPEGV